MRIHILADRQSAKVHNIGVGYLIAEDVGSAS